MSPAARSASSKLKNARPDFGPLLDIHCRAAGFPVGTPEHVFHPTRKWRFDRAWPTLKIAVEIEGGAFARTQGRHNRGVGFREDCVKYGEAFSLGWRVLRVMPEHVKSGQAMAWLAALLPRTANGSRSD